MPRSLISSSCPLCLQVQAAQPPPCHPSFRRAVSVGLAQQHLLQQARQSSLPPCKAAVDELARKTTLLNLAHLTTQLEAIETLTWEEHLQRPGLLSGCEPPGAPLRVAVLLSGGVDSSLALKLLQAAGHQVTAFYLQIWFQEDFQNFWASCPWEDDLEVCQQVCQAAEIPLHVVPLTPQYWDQVVSYAVNEIRAGHTPNPDMLCNSRVKFGAFYDYLQAQHASEFDRIASGHYAAVHRSLSSDDTVGPVQLMLTPDAMKDQTYFLGSLTQAQLSRTMFPLGSLTKAEVRRLAAAAGLPNRERPDSQGICFLGKVRFSEFVKTHLGTWPGLLIEEETNAIVGVHEGMWFFTPGQRKGIFLSGGPWYVTRKDTTTNAVYVSRQYYEDIHHRNTFWCNHFNWIDDSYRKSCPQHLQCKVRHGPAIYWAHLHWTEAADTAQIVLDGNDQGLALGQYAVFYLDGVCLGSAVICAPPAGKQGQQSVGCEDNEEHVLSAA